MKNKEYILKHIIVVGVSIVALILAFYMPYLSFKYEDYKLKDYMNPVEMKSADLESNKILLAEKLEAALSNGLNPNSYISVDIDQYNTDTRQANLDYNSAWEIGKAVLVHNFVGQSVFEIEEVNKYEKELDSLRFYEELTVEEAESDDTPWKSVIPYLLFNQDDFSTFLVWQVWISDYTGRFLYMIIDDESGKLLNMYGYKEIFGVDITNCCKFNNVENEIGEYYGFQNVTKNIRMLSRLNRDKMPFDNPEDFWGAESLNFICYRYNLFNDNDSEYITMDFIVPEGDNDWFLFNCLSYDDMAETVEQDNDLSDLPQDELDDILFEDYGSATDAE